MFHLWLKPNPPAEAGRVTPPHAVDSSATIVTPGCCSATVALTSRRKSMASMFSRPPYWVGAPLPAELVGRPPPYFGRVIEVEHRSHRVDPQAIDVELLQPVEGVGHQEVAN